MSEHNGSAIIDSEVKWYSALTVVRMSKSEENDIIDSLLDARVPIKRYISEAGVFIFPRDYRRRVEEIFRTMFGWIRYSVSDITLTDK